MSLTLGIDTIESPPDPLTSILRVIEIQCASVTNVVISKPSTEARVCEGPAFYWLLEDSAPLEVQTDGGSVTVGGGDLVFVTTSGEHHIGPSRYQDSFSAENISESVREETPQKMIAATLSYGRNDLDSFVSLLPSTIQVHAATQDASILGILSLLKHEAKMERAGYGAITNSLAQTLFVLALRRHAELDNEEWMTWLQHASVEFGLFSTLQLIRDNLDTPWTVDSLAEAASMSRSRYAIRFVELFGRTPIRYLFDCRMSRAQDLLQQNHFGLKEVARMIGYKSTSAFSTAFKKWSGMSPQEYRKSLRLS